MDNVVETARTGAESGENKEIKEKLDIWNKGSGNSLGISVVASRGEYCFDMDGNEITCLTDYYEVDNLFDIEDARFLNQPMFYKVTLENGKEVYVSTGNIRQSQFVDIVDSLSGRVAVLSGMHGGPDGNLFVEFNGVKGTQLLNEDIKKWEKVENVNIYDISILNSNDINQIINENDVTVCGWCFSERSKLIIKALGKGE